VNDEDINNTGTFYLWSCGAIQLSSCWKQASISEIALRSVCATAATSCCPPQCLWVSPRKWTEFLSTANLFSTSARTELTWVPVVYVLWRNANKIKFYRETNTNKKCLFSSEC
jgi:hypothetical protein